MNQTKNELVYLACPYTHKDHNIMVMRFNMVNKVAADLMAKGKYVFSPISHTHPIAEAGSLPRSWDYWEGYDRRVLKCCDKIMVVCLPGWTESTGVKAEIKIGQEMGIPVEFIETTAI